jgi:RNA polymerase sigma-70 factor (ECF subfamily)
MLLATSLIDEYRQLEDDLELVGLSQRGDQDAFRVLVERYQDWMVRMLEHLVSNRQDAEELAQNVFFKAYTNLGEFRQQASFKTWLRAIATRQAFDLYRHRHRKGRDQFLASEQLDVMTSKPNQEGAEIVEAISNTMGRIPYIYREILTLRYIEDMELTEIQDVLGLGASATRMRLSRARESFREIYEESGFEL